MWAIQAAYDFYSGHTQYETVIGLEVHVQLLTESKMFCGCSAAYADAPPEHPRLPGLPGLPGVLPVINEQAVEFTIMTGAGAELRRSRRSRKFDRKNYPYPDLLKGYQISQYDLPLCAATAGSSRGRGRAAAPHRHHARATSKRTPRA